MEQYGICLNTVLPVRREPSERSEMVTQLLFGDSCEIFEKKDTFYNIRNTDDQYEGWVDCKMLILISQHEYIALREAPVFRICVPTADAFCLTDKQIYRFSAGSKLPFYDPDTSSIEIAGLKIQIHQSFVSYLPSTTKDNVTATARMFLNTPYLWGGKNIMGIDCSGFVQVVFSLCGYLLARDACEQSKEGTVVNNLDEAVAGDLLFFEKDNKIAHVGVYLGDNKIIHASGKVRIDDVNKKGIFDQDLSDYTHLLSTIRRL